MRIERVSDIQIRRMKLAALLMGCIPDSFDLTLCRHALPAELVLTSFTRHVIASIRLLNSPAAAFSRAHLRHSINHLLGRPFVISGFLT